MGNERKTDPPTQCFNSRIYISQSSDEKQCHTSTLTTQNGGYTLAKAIEQIFALIWFREIHSGRYEDI